MNTIPRKRIVKRLVLLAALGVSMVYLRKPETAYAQGTCQEQCLAIELTCIKECGSSGGCGDGCATAFAKCVEGCNH